MGTVTGFLAGGVGLADTARLALALVDCVPAVLFFLGLGLLLGASFHRRGPAFATGIGITLGLFALNIVGSVIDKLSWLTYANPYGYYGRTDLFHADPDLLYWTLLPGMAGLMAVLAWRRFDTKDLKG